MEVLQNRTACNSCNLKLIKASALNRCFLRNLVSGASVRGGAGGGGDPPVFIRPNPNRLCTGDVRWQQSEHAAAETSARRRGGRGGGGDYVMQRAHVCGRPGLKNEGKKK